MFVAGVMLFTIASLAGGFATSQAQLVAARVAQGVGGAIASPTALSLITSTFPEGLRRNKAMGVYAAGHRGVHAHRLVAAESFWERAGDQRQCCWRGDGATYALGDASRDQLRLTGGEAARQRGDGEQHHSGHKHPPPAEQSPALPPSSSRPPKASA